MNCYTAYAPRVFFLRDHANDREKLLFHVQSDDYFGTLATILALVIDLCPTLDGIAKGALESARTDLVYLQNTHRIVPKARYTRG